ncbi:4'-phosphopantetheinyl transferase family protein [Thioclava kandeliae]|uniref:Enterobactin synthase component D n=1 Tax=Thioclava kandeliae TaxID=3070818 RepID=A0ABV1SJB7_9RHOB
MRLPRHADRLLCRPDSMTILLTGHDDGPAHLRADRLVAQGQQALGLPASRVPCRPRAPRDWPPGTRGSLSHWGPFTLCLLHRGTGCHWGVDIEGVPEWQTAQDILSVALGPSERALLDHGSDALLWQAAAVFSAKESVYKAVYPSVGRVLEFDAIRLAARPSGGALVFAPSAELLAFFSARRRITVPVFHLGEAVLSFCRMEDARAARVDDKEQPPEIRAPRAYRDQAP